ncbi:MAG: isocitrate/isopropylmalate family dehydrogenase [Candidatus Rokubacteria bacterium]|nr:isocitrate/isopropylmalate family dehydrogenase [Candidatus Rokubacteria bacterium]
MAVAVHRNIEAVHGSAPDIAWRNIANLPVLVMSGVMALDDLAETRGDAACAASAGGVRTATTTPLPKA